VRWEEEGGGRGKEGGRRKDRGSRYEILPLFLVGGKKKNQGGRKKKRKEKRIVGAINVPPLTGKGKNRKRRARAKECSTLSLFSPHSSPRIICSFRPTCIWEEGGENLASKQIFFPSPPSAGNSESKGIRKEGRGRKIRIPCNPPFLLLSKGMYTREEKEEGE